MPILPAARHSRADQARLAQVFGGVQLGLERYEQAFRDNDILPSVLPELTDADLKDAHALPDELA